MLGKHGKRKDPSGPMMSCGSSDAYATSVSSTATATAAVPTASPSATDAASSQSPVVRDIAPYGTVDARNLQACTESSSAAQVSKTRFTREELLLLAGGCDISEMVHGDWFVEHTLEAALSKDAGLAGWRQDLVEHLQPLGLVDGHGNPCEELAEAVYPLAKPGMVVCREREHVNAERTIRTVARDAAICIYGEHATLVRKVGGIKETWSLEPLGSRDRWDMAFLTLFGQAEEFSFSRHQLHAVDFDAADSVEAKLLRGKPRDVEAYAAELGIAPDALLDLTAGKAISKNWRSRELPRATVLDYTGASTFERTVGFSLPLPIAGQPPVRCKVARLYPQQGFILAEQMCPPQGYPRDWRTIGLLRSMCTFCTLDFVDGGSILDRILDFDEDAAAGLESRLRACGVWTSEAADSGVDELTYGQMQQMEKVWRESLG